MWMTPRQMEPATASQLAALIAPLRERPDASAILSDIDGTLAPIVQDPGAAAVPDDAREVLAALAERYALVGCLSGRDALEARRIVGLSELAYAGNHGFEMLRPGDDAPALEASVRDREHLAREFAEALDSAELDAIGVRREDKGPIQAFHWRGAPDEARAKARAEEIAKRAEAEGLVPRWGRK